MLGYKQDQRHHGRVQISNLKESCTRTSHILGLCIMGNLGAIHTVAREEAMAVLHTNRPEVTMMKCLARSHLWWSGLDVDVESKVRLVETCQIHNLFPSAVAILK